MAEAAIRARGRSPSGRAARAVTSAAVPSTRDRRIAARRSRVQRPPATGSPARWTIASTPRSRGGSTASPGCHPTTRQSAGRRCRAAIGSRDQTSTSRPAASRRATKGRPTSPVPPVTTSFTVRSESWLERASILRRTAPCRGNRVGRSFRVVSSTHPSIPESYLTPGIRQCGKLTKSNRCRINVVNSCVGRPGQSLTSLVCGRIQDTHAGAERASG